MAEKPSKTKLYAQAEQVLRERHFEEFQEIVAEVYAEHGYVYKRRLSAEERAERDRLAELAKVEAQLAELRAKAEALSMSTAVDKAGDEDGLSEFAGPAVKREPYGGAYPVDPEALEKSGFPV